MTPATNQTIKRGPRGPYKIKWPKIPKGSVTADIVREMLLYDPETGIFTYKVGVGSAGVGDVAGTMHHSGYWDINVCGNVFRAHRLAWLYVYGAMPSSGIDHINGDRADNKISNLRQATQAENCQNVGTSKLNTSGVTGLHWHKLVKKWMAYIHVDKRRIILGYFSDKDEAARVRAEAKMKYHTFNPVTIREVGPCA